MRAGVSEDKQHAQKAVAYVHQFIRANADFPGSAVLQEMHDLLVEKTKLNVKLRYHEQFLEGGSKFKGTESAQYVEALRERERIHAREKEITERLETIHEKELGDLQKVADDAVLECYEEALYGQPS